MIRGLFEPMHLIVILVIVLLIFGPSRLGEIGKGLGKSIRDFKKAMSDDEKDDASTEREITAPKALDTATDMASEKKEVQKENI